MIKKNLTEYLYYKNLTYSTSSCKHLIITANKLNNQSKYASKLFFKHYSRLSSLIKNKEVKYPKYITQYNENISSEVIQSILGNAFSNIYLKSNNIFFYKNIGYYKLAKPSVILNLIKKIIIYPVIAIFNK
jgi:hypothetical protein